MKLTTVKQRVLAGLALLAIAAGLVIALSGGGSHRGGHDRRSTGAAGGTAAGATGSKEAGGGAEDKRSEGRQSEDKQSEGGGEGSAEASGAEGFPTRVTVAANYLGLSRPELRARLRSGGSLGRLADKTKGKSAHGLIEVLVAAQAARLKAAKLPAATEKRRLERYRQRIERQVSRVRGSPAVEGDLIAASEYLGMSDSQLHVLVQQGQTLAQIVASQHGHSLQGLEDAIVKARTARLKQAAKAHLLSQKEERAELAGLSKKVGEEVHRKLLQSP